MYHDIRSLIPIIFLFNNIFSLIKFDLEERYSRDDINKNYTKILIIMSYNFTILVIVDVVESETGYTDSDEQNDSD